MNEAKHRQLAAMRVNTAYPTYRHIVEIITTILMFLVLVEAIATVFVASIVSERLNSGLALIAALALGLIGSALQFYLARFWNEAAQMLVDIADSVLDMNAKRDRRMPSRRGIHGPHAMPDDADW